LAECQLFSESQNIQKNNKKTKITEFDEIHQKSHGSFQKRPGNLKMSFGMKVLLSKKNCGVSRNFFV